MPLLQTPVRPASAPPRVKAEELLRDVAFVLQAARTVRQAMEAPRERRLLAASVKR